MKRRGINVEDKDGNLESQWESRALGDKGRLFVDV